MSKKRRGKRKRTMPKSGVQARSQKRSLRVLAGGAPLEERPEYRAQMQAWRECGSPQQGDFGSLQCPW